MTTWDELRAHLRLHYILQTDEDDGIDLMWQFDTDDGDDTYEQYQRLDVIEAAGRPAVVVLTPVGPPDAIDSRDALEHNAHLAVGALAITEETLVVRAVLLLDSSTPETVDDAMALAAHEAARLRSDRGLA